MGGKVMLQLTSREKENATMERLSANEEAGFPPCWEELCAYLQDPLLSLWIKQGPQALTPP